MFSWFKKFKDISEYPDTWSVGQGRREGRPIFVRIRNGLNDAIGHPNYPFQVGVAVPLLRPTKDGLTTDDEAQELNLIEDILEKKITINKKEGVFVMAITTNGMREFVFYVREWKPEFFEKEVKTIAARHKLQFLMQKDPKWDTFKRFTKFEG